MSMTIDPQEGYITKIGKQAWKVDAERIQFLDSRFYRTASGAYVPSVTAILEAYPKGAQYYEWLKRNGQDSDEIRDEAGRRGSVVHEATEALDQGAELSLMTDEGEPKYKLSEWAMIGRYAEFRERFPAKVHAIETKLASDELGYAGTLDRIMTMPDGRTLLVDIKTSGSVWPSYWLQQAAYHELIHATGFVAHLFPDGDVPEIGLAILWLNAKTRGEGKGGAIQGAGWQLVEQPRHTRELFDLFRKTHGLWLAEHSDEKPKTYKLNLKLNNR
jgi:hypothetical protein